MVAKKSTSTTEHITGAPVAKSPMSRPPVVVVMGHIDHGKSTLLDYIRKTNVVDKEVGGITQKMSSYEVVHKTADGEKSITFIDTPGHESFNAIRKRGASAADIAILVVSAEDGVKPQTIDALKAIKEGNIPYIVGISKIDKPNADIQRAKLSMAENEIYVEGFGGDISAIPFSGKTGEGVNDLLDMILLLSEVENFTATSDGESESIVIESQRDKVRGISATLIVKSGTLRSGDVLVAGNAISPVRILENFLGKSVKEAGPSKPVRVVGWSEEPEVGGLCITFATKKEAEKYVYEQSLKNKAPVVMPKQRTAEEVAGTAIVPLVLKAESSGSVEALKYEIKKLKIDRVEFKIVAASIGDITEADVKLASAKPETLVIGFTTKVEPGAKSTAERFGIEVNTFDIIYKMTEWLQEIGLKRAPRLEVEEVKGLGKILKVFSANKDKQVLGCRVETGSISLNDRVKVLRRDVEIGEGRIRELQHMKAKTSTVDEGKECGMMVESKIEIVAGDKLQATHIVVK